MKILNMHNLRNTNFHDTPYRYSKVKNIFNLDIVDRLCQEYPLAYFSRCETTAQEKTYSMYMRQLVNMHEKNVTKELDLSDLSDAWRLFCSELLSEEYRSVMSDHAKYDLTRCSVEINCWQYFQGCWLSPHTDKPDKVISHLFYFNPIWDLSWGGAFQVLRSNNSNDIHEEIFPSIETSLMLVRNNVSSHSVAPLTCPQNVSRRLMQIIYWKE